MNIINIASSMLGLTMCLFGCVPSNLTVKVEEKIDIPIEYRLGDKLQEKVIEGMIAKYATGTKAYQMKRTIFCESAGYQNIQSKIIKNGIQEPSYGIAQIHLPSHPDVTMEEALDPEFAVKFMSEHWENTKWFGYFRMTDTCNIIYK